MEKHNCTCPLPELIYREREEYIREMQEYLENLKKSNKKASPNLDKINNLGYNNKDVSF